LQSFCLLAYIASFFADAMEITNTETAVPTPKPQARVTAALDRASELQYEGKLDDAASELERGLSIARETPYEIEFMLRIRLGTTLADLYLALDRLPDAVVLARDEAAFAEKINQIIQARGTPEQKRTAMSGFLQTRDRATQLTLIGQPAPEISVKQWINRGPASLSELRGRVVLLEFWATWCKPCQEMFPKLNALAAQYREQGLEIVALTRHYLAYRGTAESMAQELELMRKMVDQHSVNFHVGVAEDEKLQTVYGANGLPTVALIDRAGIVRYIGAGGDEPLFVKLLAEHLSPN
jgi:thiol-disulfide isomerase/thioredoxin